MEKAELKNIFESPFNLEKWHTVMQSLFRVKTIRQQPKEIPLSPNDLAYNAFELGDTTTSDERIIGFYLVTLKPGVWIEVNRVSLRNLLRNVYNNDVDGALIVFQLGDKWRFSYVSQIREIDDEGNFVKTETEPKRYTYLMGKDEICRTAADRFHLLSGKPIALNDIKEAFSVEKLNKEFYNELSNWYFWALQNVKFPDDFEKDEEVRNATSVIRLITRLIFVWFLKQKKLIPEELFDEREIKHLLNFSDKTGSTYYKAILQNLFFATLNTEMGCDKRKFVNRQYGVQGFYRYERFFNDKERFLQLTQNIPFLNGGLFENLDKNVGEPGEKRIDCFSNKITNETRLSVPDYLFFAGTEHADLSRSYPDNNHGNVKIRGLIQLLKSYNFTIEENTPFEIEVALDPELLGKVFENLLASYNPETKTTARKQTGSFYTPREIVNYMVDESLIAFLKNQLLEENPGVKVLGKSQIELFGNETRKGRLTFEQKINESRWIGKEPELEDNLRLLLDFNNEKNPFNEKDTVLIMKAIDTCTILDPACGSGAFPMGILQKLVHLLQKLDKNNEYWRKIQEERAKAENQALINRIQKDKEYAEHISFEDIRKKLLKELDERLDEIRDSFDVNQNEPDYARKLFLVENCIYGVDIQPIAVQIAKLRFFISLIIDQKIDESKKNRGILTLPNLETKFVAANTLIGINRTGGVIRINEVIDKEKELSEVRHKHFSAQTPETKRKYRELDFRLREEIANLIATETKNNVVANQLVLAKKQAEFEQSKKAVEALKNEKGKKKYKARLSILEQEITKLKETIIAPDSIDKTARQLADWNPYDQNISASFFDSEWMFGITKGFDIVIGNPPYKILTKNNSPELELYLKTYKSIKNSNSKNLYVLFIESTLQLLPKHGTQSFIVPEGLFQTRSYIDCVDLLNKAGFIKNVVTFSQFVFENAVTGNLIFVFNNNQKGQTQYFHFDKLFNIRPIENVTNPIITNIENNTKPLNTIASLFKGMVVKDRGTVINSIFSGQPDIFLLGKNITKWCVTSKYYTNYSELEIVGGTKKIEKHQQFPRILIRRTGDNLCCAFLEESALTESTLYSCWSTSEIENKFLIGVLNSSLLNYYNKEINITNQQGFPQILMTDLESIPIKITQNQQPIITLVDQILAAKKSNPQADTLEWEAEIDARVFQLYGLTEEEIGQVLASLPGVTEREKQAIWQKWEELSQAN